MNDTHETDINCHIVAILTLVSFLAVILLPDGDILRIILALPMLLFYPGYLATAALFYNKRIDPIFHIILSVVLSICFVSLVALFLGLTVDTIGIRLLPSAILIFVSTLVFYLIWMAGSITFRSTQRYYETQLQKKQYRKHHQITVPKKEPVPSLSIDYSEMKTDSVFLVILVVIMIIAGFGLYSASNTQEPGWSDLYLYSSNPSLPFKIPSNWTLNKNISVYIKVINHEKKTVTYMIIGNTTIDIPKYYSNEVFRKSISMVNEQSFEWNVTFKFIYAGKNTIRFNLFKNGIYDREVHALINVK